MGEHDLSGLRINRDKPSSASTRALKLSLGLAALAVVFVAALLWFARDARGVDVVVARADIVGGGAGSAPGLTANGYVVARTQASVSSKISGRMEYLAVSEGSVVKKGEIIARLENQDYRASVAQAEAELLRARAALREAEATRDQLRRDVARARDLLKANLISSQGAEDLEAQLTAAEARVGVQEAQVQASVATVGVAKANLENTFIRAPFDGTVLRKDAEVGEVVAPVATGSGLTRGAVVTMADLETLEVEVDVNEAYIAQLKNGQPARIVLDAYPNEAYRGAIRQIVPTADRQRATVLVKVSILDRDSKILPEMAARVDFLAPVVEGEEATTPRVFVPAAAVRSEGGQTVVWIVRDGIAYRRAVEAGPVSGGRREIRSGLSGGEQVVIAGPADLSDETAVNIVTQ